MVIRTAAELGHLVRDAREQRGLTQLQLATQVGVSRKWLIAFEAGKLRTDLSLVLRTLNALDIAFEAGPRSAGKAANAVDLDAIVDAAKTRRR